MKKQMLALLLSAVILVSGTACQSDDIYNNNNAENSNTIQKSNNNSDISKPNIEFEEKGSIACNGVYHNSKRKILSIKSGGTEKIFAADETQISYNFINEHLGYCFVFNENSRWELSLFFKTEDGGNTWIPQKSECDLSLQHQEFIVCAKMLNEEVGFISGKHWADDNFSKRTYLTIDGGKTWSQIVLPPDDYYTKGDSSKNTTYISCGYAYDLLYENDQYILYLRDNYENFRYVSSDLKTWSLVEQ